jgi:hypothetical protein
MALCDRPCCGGIDTAKQERERQLAERKLAFEAWYNDPVNADTIARIKAEVQNEQNAKVPA